MNIHNHVKGAKVLYYVIIPCVLIFMRYAATAEEKKKSNKEIEEIRAVWVTRWDYTKPEDVYSIMSNCHAFNFNLVLFQVRGNATVFYKSEIEPWAFELTSNSVKTLGKDPGWDPLATAIEYARQFNLELHAWMNTFPAWKTNVPPPKKAKQLWNTHPDWFMVDKKGKVMFPEKNWKDWYTFISPGIPAVQEYIKEVYSEVVKKYKVDGIHFDYVRYPGEIGDYSYDKVSLMRFKNECNATPETNPQLWNQWRRDQVTAVVRNIYHSATAINQHIKISASVAGNYRHGYEKNFQDSHLWISEGIMDMIMPMIYTEDTNRFRIDAEDHIKFAQKEGKGRFVCPGIGLFKIKSPEIFITQINIARELGANGITIFSYSGLFPKHKPNQFAKALVENSGPFAKPARIPAMSWKIK